ncbi:hypothetical protein GCM10010439_14720 [Actinocorallia aurantiaca]|uniref:Ricin B lectin domain-containing protein n=1 Tax=Actinocorallia aurantiaca TaxID=46204 RepID=A0ABN3U4A4_9ACTN
MRSLLKAVTKLVGCTVAGFVGVTMLASAAHADGIASYRNQGSSYYNSAGTLVYRYTSPAGESVSNGSRLALRKGVHASHFFFIFTSTGTPSEYRFQNYVTDWATSNADKAMLDVSGSGTADGTWADHWQYNGGANQRWKYIDAGSGWYTLRPQHTSNRCLDRENANEGAQLYIWTCNSTNPQKWQHYYW